MIAIAFGCLTPLKSHLSDPSNFPHCLIRKIRVKQGFHGDNSFLQRKEMQDSLIGHCIHGLHVLYIYESLCIEDLYLQALPPTTTPIHICMALCLAKAQHC